MMEAMIVMTAMVNIRNSILIKNKIYQFKPYKNYVEKITLQL